MMKIADEQGQGQRMAINDETAPWHHHGSFLERAMMTAALAWTTAPWHYWSSLAHVNKRASQLVHC